jgi:hypothetical protein
MKGLVSNSSVSKDFDLMELENLWKDWALLMVWEIEDILDL